MQVAALPAARVEAGAGRAALAEAADQVVLHRVHPGGGHVRVLAQVEGGVELRDGADLAGVAVAQEVGEAERAGRDTVALAVPGGVEMQHGAGAGRLATLHVVQQRVAGAAGIAGAVVVRVEIRVGPAAFLPAVAMPVDEGRVAAALQIGVAGEEPCAVEQAGALQLGQAMLLRTLRHAFRHDRCGWLDHGPRREFAVTTIMQSYDGPRAPA